MVFPDVMPLSSLDKYQHSSGNLTPPPSGNLSTLKTKATGSSKIPVFLYQPTWSHIPQDHNLDTHYTQNLKSRTGNLHFLHTRCNVHTATTPLNQFCCTFRPLPLFFLTLNAHSTANANPLTVYKPSPCWDPTTYVMNKHTVQHYTV